MSQPNVNQMRLLGMYDEAMIIYGWEMTGIASLGASGRDDLLQGLPIRLN